MKKIWKALIAVLLTIALAMPCLSVAAASNSPTEKKLASVVTEKASYVYAGNYKTPKVIVKDTNGDTVSSKYYTVTYSNNKDAGTAKVVVTAKAPYTGKVKTTFTITKKPATLVSNSFTVTYSKAKTRASADLVSGNGVFKTSGDPNIVVTDAGVIKVKAGTPVGTYKIGIQKAEGVNEQGMTATITVKVTRATPTVKTSLTADYATVKKGTTALDDVVVGSSVTKVSGDACLTVTRDGVVKVKKGTAKGTYTITIKKSATSSYHSVTATITVTVR